MRIHAFSYFVEPFCTPYILQNTDLVIDGQNFMYNMYEQSSLQYMFGSESDKFADIVRKAITGFQNTNVNCYFIFKGGHNSSEKIRTDHMINGNRFNIEKPCFIMPIFVKCIYKDVLREMGVKQVICELESKQECIALAQKLNCPVLSFDIEYAFSGVPYISYKSLEISDTNIIKCELFQLKRFLKDLNLSEDKLSIFIAICNETAEISQRDFYAFFKFINAFPFKRRYTILFEWLSRTSGDIALKCVCKYLATQEKRRIFLAEEIKAQSMVEQTQTMGIPATYLITGTLQILEKDPSWFEKGVVLRHIPIQYINMRNYSVFYGSWTIEDQNQEDSVLLSLDIIEYAYGLLTNFSKALEFKTFRTNNTPRMSFEDLRRAKPDVNTETSVFENGWDNILSLRLLENFFDTFLKGFNYNALERVPANVQLLLIALVYFRHKKGKSLTNLEHSIILSYIALDVLTARRDSKSEKKNSAILDADRITESDKEAAVGILNEYFSCGYSEAMEIFNPERLHPSVEFQHCLQHLNCLNTLCGAPYQPTDYTRTFNGTFVYKLLCDLEDEEQSNGWYFLKQKLSLAPTVYTYFKNLVEAFEEFHIIKS